MVRERQRDGFPGVPMLLLVLAVGIGLFLNVVRLVGERAFPPFIFFTIVSSIVLMLFLLAGFFVVNPNEGRVLQFFGTYAIGANREYLVVGGATGISILKNNNGATPSFTAAVA